MVGQSLPRGLRTSGGEVGGASGQVNKWPASRLHSGRGPSRGMRGMPASIASLRVKPQTPIMRMLRDSIAEHRALQIAQVCGEKIAALDELPASIQERYRAAAYLALGWRTFGDAEAWARDYYPQ